MVNVMCMPALGRLAATRRFQQTDQASENPDAIVVQGLRARDPRALATAYDRYGRIAFAVILRAVHDAAVAEDLVQETFLRVWNRAGSFDPERGELGSWIVAVARNQAIDYLRSVNGRMAAGEVSLRESEGSPTLVGAEEEILSIDRKRRVEEALRKLTPVQRQLIHLAYYEGLSHSEMARHLKRPLGTVKTWVGAALRVLRAEMK